MTGAPVNYTTDLLERDRGQRDHIVRELREIRDQYRIAGASIVELGCGLGDNLRVFAPSNTVLGLEGLPDAVESGRASGLSMQVANLEKPLPLPSESQDWVLCLDVLEHLLDPLGSMREMRRILRPGGHAVVNVPNHLTLKGRIRILQGRGLDVHHFFPDADDWNNPHVRFFTYAGFLRMIQLAGFEIADDRSGKFPDIRCPIGFGRSLLRFAARRRPAWFAGGFFMVLRRQTDYLFPADRARERRRGTTSAAVQQLQADDEWAVEKGRNQSSTYGAR